MRQYLQRSSLIGAVLVAASAGLFAQSQYVVVQFYNLSVFSYSPKEPWDTFTPRKISPTGIPTEVWQLEGKKISIIGLGLPTTWERDGSPEFILTISQDTCAYGATPRINEWMLVSMVGGKKVNVSNGAEYMVKGTFHVREKVENGLVVQLFSIDADSIQYQ
jgi:hypothetical protein